MAIDNLEWSLPNLAATQQLGVTLGRSLPAGTVLLLEGDLGSGKTSLVQGIGQGLEIPDPIVSPTFTLINEYPEGRIPLYHLDLYRLSPSDVAGLQPELYWEGIEYPLGILAIEWAERLPYHPDTYLTLRLIRVEDKDPNAPDRRQAQLRMTGIPAGDRTWLNRLADLQGYR